MIHIKKGKEPPELIRYKKEKFAHYEGMPRDTKEAVKASLLKEQGYLCAYCMRRIFPDTMTIEHYNCQSEISEQEALDYKIMLGVCPGNRGTKEHRVKLGDMICDAHRGNTFLKVNPQKASDISLIKYNGMGMICSDDAEINQDVNDTLNLNCKVVNLPENRKSALDALKVYLKQQQEKGLWKRSLLEKIKRKVENANELEQKQEYSGILIYYLDKQLKRPVTTN